MAEEFKVPAPVGEKRRVKRPLSPQPSTSAASTPYIPEEEPTAVHATNLDGADKTPVVVNNKILSLICTHASALRAPTPAPKKEPTPFPFRPPKLGGAKWSEEAHRNSVYSHVDPDILIAIGKLRGLKSSRRSTRRRRLNNIAQAKFALSYSEAIKHLEPMVMEEIINLRGHQMVIDSAFEKFADTVNGIADKLEGNVEPSEHTQKLEAIEKKVAELREKRRARNPNAEEFKISEEEKIRRLREETKAAVEALSTGDPEKERTENRFSHILDTLKKFK